MIETMTDPANPLRILIPEGSSTSGREAITILGLAGHHVEVCDPSPWCLARYSRFVRKFHRCPGLRRDPAGFLAFVERLIANGRFDVLLPTHEQGFLFARMAHRFKDRIAVALPSFESYRTAHDKAGFSRLLDQLDLPQPPTRILKSQSEPRGATRFPAVVKTSVGTASRGVWFVHNESELASALHEIDARGAFAGEVLLQDMIAGTTEKAQSVFCRGRLVGFHAFRAGVRRRRRRRGDQAKRQPSGRARLSGEARRRAVVAWRRCRSTIIMPDDGTAPLLDRLQSAAGRAVQCLAVRHRSRRATVARLARRGAGSAARGPRWRAHASCHAGAARHRLPRRLARRRRQGILAACSTTAVPMPAATEELTPVAARPARRRAACDDHGAARGLAGFADKLARGGFGEHLLDLKSIAEIEREGFPAVVIPGCAVGAGPGSITTGVDCYGGWSSS